MEFLVPSSNTILGISKERNISGVLNLTLPNKKHWTNRMHQRNGKIFPDKKTSFKLGTFRNHRPGQDWFTNFRMMHKLPLHTTQLLQTFDVADSRRIKLSWNKELFKWQQ